MTPASGIVTTAIDLAVGTTAWYYRHNLGLPLLALVPIRYYPFGSTASRSPLRNLG